jgi:hypothetical protein
MPQKKTPGKRTNESAKAAEASPEKAAKAPARTRARKESEPPNGSQDSWREPLTGREPAGSELSHEEIAAKAYALWERRGRPDGSPQEDWYRAQQELLR